MKSWDRRLAAAQRIESTPATALDPTESSPLPDGLHPDDVAAVRQLSRHARTLDRPFSTTVLGRIIDSDGQNVRNVEITVMANNSAGSILVSDSAPAMPTDRLTGLPGRGHLLSAIDGSLAEGREEGRAIAVFNIDVDRFKAVNDINGYDAGDQLITALAARIASVLRPEDVFARTGGDGFTIACPDVLGPAEAAALAEMFRSACSDAPADDPLSAVTLSVGYTIGTTDADGAVLMRESETALYRAKSRGRDRCEMFDDDLRGQVERRITVDHRLRMALENDTIEVHYQPIVELATGAIVGAEALLRIAGADGRHLDPRELVSAAEDSGLIRRIEDRVMHQALETLSGLPEFDAEPLFMSINISDQRLSDSRFPLSLARTLHGAGGCADQIHLEIHPAALSKSGSGVRLMTQLRALGVTVVIDELAHTLEGDFVSNKSVDCVKLDRRIVRAIHGVQGRARAKLVINAIRERGIDACAVGVESEADLRAVTELGCRFGQGFLFSPPVDRNAFGELVRRTTPLSSDGRSTQSSGQSTSIT